MSAPQPPRVEPASDEQRTAAALRDSEERYRDLFENANDVIYTLDLTGHITSVNKRAEQAFGYVREECLGRNAADFVPPEQHARMHEALRQKLAGEASPTTYELEIVRKDGQRVLLEVSSRLIVRDGVPVGIQGIARDITERRRAELALREADRHKDEFLAMLAHELRNPLAPIRNATEVLKRLGPPHPLLAQARDLIERQVSHLTRLVDDLLDVSRIASGKVLLRKQPVDLVPLIRNAVEDHRHLIEESDLRLSLALPERTAWTEGDPTRLVQVVGNLLNNAFKFTDAGGCIGVRLEVDADAAVLTVRDTGIGMEADLLRRLFEPFRQAERSIDRSRGGLGLGLALVKGLVELHGGEVRAASAGPGHGSAFTVRLPLMAEPAQQANRSGCSAPGRARRVLIIEDNRDVAESLRLLLDLYGHEAVVVHGGAAGVETARRLRPDVVLCDIGLPGGMDGYAVARTLRADVEPPELLIALSGYGQEEDRRQARQAGFDRHLTKPVDPNVLTQILDG
jgi:PAS domain S-box-containing protein